MFTKAVTPPLAPRARRVVGDAAYQRGADPIRCHGLTKHFGAIDALSDLDLVVPRGSVTGFLGPNGAGKTTVLRLLAGLTRPTSGAALLWGEPAASASARARLGYMPADPTFAERLSGTDNLELLASLQGGGSVDRDWACDLLGLRPGDLQRPVGTYSSGMTQKLAIVQAIQHRPDLVIFDEPANRLDPLAHRRFEQLVREIQARGATVLLSSHALAEVQDVCDRVAMIRDGRLLDVRGVQELRGAHGRRVTLRYAAEPLPAAPHGLTQVRRAGLAQTGIATGDVVSLLRLALDDPRVIDVLVEEPSLEEMFVDLYTEAAR